MQKQLMWCGLIVVGTLALAGCSRKNVKADQGAAAGAPSTLPAETGGAADAGGAATALPGQAGTTVEQGRVIYFDYDSSEIRPEFNNLLAAVARSLVGNASVKVRLEGNTDERGSPEYNIGLGERRAQSVKRALMLQGVSESQLTTVSYGEERPVDSGQNEAAWAKNRRVEIAALN
ncbi:MAG: peptidoglycan-associated lipoprotein Pal [Steroidobacteraceae bacterium]